MKQKVAKPRPPHTPGQWPASKLQSWRLVSDETPTGDTVFEFEGSWVRFEDFVDGDFDTFTDIVDGVDGTDDGKRRTLNALWIYITLNRETITDDFIKAEYVLEAQKKLNDGGATTPSPPGDGNADVAGADASPAPSLGKATTVVPPAPLVSPGDGGDAGNAPAPAKSALPSSSPAIEMVLAEFKAAVASNLALNKEIEELKGLKQRAGVVAGDEYLKPFLRMCWKVRLMRNKRVPSDLSKGCVDFLENYSNFGYMGSVEGISETSKRKLLALRVFFDPPQGAALATLSKKARPKGTQGGAVQKKGARAWKPIPDSALARQVRESRNAIEELGQEDVPDTAAIQRARADLQSKEAELQTLNTLNDEKGRFLTAMGDLAMHLADDCIRHPGIVPGQIISDPAGWISTHAAKKSESDEGWIKLDSAQKKVGLVNAFEAIKSLTVAGGPASPEDLARLIEKTCQGIKVTTKGIRRMARALAIASDQFSIDDGKLSSTVVQSPKKKKNTKKNRKKEPPTVSDAVSDAEKNDATAAKKAKEAAKKAVKDTKKFGSAAVAGKTIQETPPNIIVEVGNTSAGFAFYRLFNPAIKKDFSVCWSVAALNVLVSTEDKLRGSNDLVAFDKDNSDQRHFCYTVRCDQLASAVQKDLLPGRTIPEIFSLWGLQTITADLEWPAGTHVLDTAVTGFMFPMTLDHLVNACMSDSHTEQRVMAVIKTAREYPKDGHHYITIFVQDRGIYICDPENTTAGKNIVAGSVESAFKLALVHLRRRSAVKAIVPDCLEVDDASKILETVAAKRASERRPLSTIEAKVTSKCDDCDHDIIGREVTKCVPVLVGKRPESVVPKFVVMCDGEPYVCCAKCMGSFKAMGPAKPKAAAAAAKQVAQGGDDDDSSDEDELFYGAVAERESMASLAADVVNWVHYVELGNTNAQAIHLFETRMSNPDKAYVKAWLNAAKARIETTLYDGPFLTQVNDALESSEIAGAGPYAYASGNAGPLLPRVTPDPDFVAPQKKEFQFRTKYAKGFFKTYDKRSPESFDRGCKNVETRYGPEVLNAFCEDAVAYIGAMEPTQSEDEVAKRKEIRATAEWYLKNPSDGGDSPTQAPSQTISPAAARAAGTPAAPSTPSAPEPTTTDAPTQAGINFAKEYANHEYAVGELRIAVTRQDEEYDTDRFLEGVIVWCKYKPEGQATNLIRAAQQLLRRRVAASAAPRAAFVDLV